MFLLGYDIGSSTIKAALIDAQSHEVKGIVQYPSQEMDIISRQSGWAEQQPEVWWQDFCTVTQKLLEATHVQPHEIRGIGIAYQMHGLVLIDKDQQVLRPSIIWCDSRAVAIGDEAFRELGESHCLNNLLNSPGNFTASKLKWVKDNEPEVYEKADKLLLPGDFIAMKLTGQAVTTIPGLTEGIFWNFKERRIADDLLRHYGLRNDLIAPVVPVFSIQGRVTLKAAGRTGLAPGTPVTYRAGDQPNNALAINVLRPGEVAATSGTSGVVYGIVDRPVFDEKSRVNSFAHVNYEQNFDRIGVLLCLNGAGIEYSWIKHQVAREGHSYTDMERMASTVPPGSDGLCVLPFGNGSERMLENQNLNAHIFNLEFNRHTRAHLYRASLEGVAFSFIQGVGILKELGLNADVIRVANDNMFQSRIFAMTIATLLDSEIEVVDTTGAIGAARAAGVGCGIYNSLEESLQGIEPSVIYEPNPDISAYQQAYSNWHSRLNLMLGDRSKKNRRTDNLISKNEVLEQEVFQKNKALANTRMWLESKNDFLQEIKSTLKTLSSSSDDPLLHNGLRKLVNKIDSNLGDQKSWTSFEEHFDLLHDDFFKSLRIRFPKLSITDLKLCAFLKMRLSTKEIAQRLHLSQRGAETGRYRLRKKLNLPKEVDLMDFLDQI